MVLALLIQRLQDGRVGEHHAVDGLEVLRRHLPAERLEGARIGFITLAQGLVGDVGQDRREVRGRFGAAREELPSPRGSLERQLRNPRHVHPARVGAAQFQGFLRHVDELEIAVLAGHLDGAPLLLGTVAIEIFPGFVAVVVPAPRQEEPAIRAQQQSHLHAGKALLHAVAGHRGAALAANRECRALCARARRDSLLALGREMGKQFLPCLIDGHALGDELADDGLVDPVFDCGRAQRLDFADALPFGLDRLFPRGGQGLFVHSTGIRARVLRGRLFHCRFLLLWADCPY